MILQSQFPRGLHVAIVGAGFSGTLTAINLMRASSDARPITISLIERSDTVCRGVAYGTPCFEHLLNVPAGRMGAFPDDITHFLRWSQNRNPEVTSDDFRPRREYGDYIESLLSESVENASGHSSLSVIRATVVDIIESEQGVTIHLSDKREIRSDLAVLALGNYPPNPLPFARQLIADNDDRYINNPWLPGVLEPIGSSDEVMIVGTGLTMVDVLLTLKTRGHKGHIEAISRHGYLPKPHLGKSTCAEVWIDEPIPTTVRTAVSQFNTRRRGAADRGETWREVLDGLRPVNQAIWGSWSNIEKSRFLRHARTLWDVHRHRIAPQLGELLESALASGELTVTAGRVQSLASEGDTLQAILRHRGSGQLREIRPGYVVNCTGPSSNIAKLCEPLLDAMLKSGTITQDPLGLGASTDESGALLNAQGVASKRLFTLGILLKPQLWETIAVPELREQAFCLAHTLLARADRIPVPE